MKRPTRRAIEATAREPLHVARNSTKADVYKLEWPPGSGEFAVLKDMKNRPAWFRLTAGRWFLRREYCALRRLKGIEGVPRALAKPDADCILMEWRAGRPVMKWNAGEVSVESLEAIARIVAQSHARGVVHGDLHRSNVLLAENGQVTLIDWATAGVFGKLPRGLKKLTFAEWCALDMRAVAKLKARHAPERLSLAEKDVLFNGSKIYRTVRSAGFTLRKILGQDRAKSPELATQRYKSFLEKAAARQIEDGVAQTEDEPVDPAREQSGDKK